MAFENNPMREQRSTLKEQHGFTNAGQAMHRFGNYDLVRRIDVGGMGEVYLAHQRTAFDREVAIKIIRPDLVHDIMARKRFLREAEVNAHIKHEHILPLFEFGEEQGRLFLVTPYIAGGTLLRRIQTDTLSVEEVHQLFAALVEAVAYIHRRGVVHRDLKPSNILLDEGDEGDVYVRLIDFGIASIQGMAASPPLTTAGNEMGTFAYMAPERLSGIAAPSNDIYSLGVILYQMITGQLPDMNQPIHLPPQYKPMEYVIRSCIASIADRFKSADELLDAFDAACDAMMSPSDDDSSTVVVRNNTPRNGRKSRPETRTLLSAEPEDMQPFRPSRPGGFVKADYEAPTTNIGTQGGQGGQGNYASNSALASITPPGQQKKRRKSPLLAIITGLIAVIILVMAGLFAVEFQSFTVVSASVSLSPQVHVVKQVFHLTAKPGQHGISVDTASMPANVFNSSKTSSQTGAATGLQCSFGIINCQPAVSTTDVDNLTALLKQKLQLDITQTLQQKTQGANAKVIGTPQFADVSVTSNPDVGSVSKTVTVTLTERGSAEYILNSDVQTLTRQLLTQKTHELGANYILLSSSIKLGQATIIGVDNNGVVSIDIAAGGVAQYQFPASELSSIQTHVQNMKLKNAVAFIKNQPGVDPNSVTIHLSSGDTMPNDTTQIKLIPINPGSIPSVDLSTASQIAVPSNNITVTPSPVVSQSPTVTATADGG